MKTPALGARFQRPSCIVALVAPRASVRPPFFHLRLGLPTLFAVSSTLATLSRSSPSSRTSSMISIRASAKDCSAWHYWVQASCGHLCKDAMQQGCKGRCGLMASLAATASG